MSQPRLPAPHPRSPRPPVWWRWSCPPAALAVVAALAGCAKPHPLPPPVSLAPPPHDPAAPHSAAKVVARAPKTIPPRLPVTEEPIAPPATVGTPEPIPVSRVPAPAPPPAATGTVTVVGLSQTEVRSLLGEPSTAGVAGPAQTWTYRVAACSLTVAFFYDVTRGMFFALTAHAEPLSEPECLATLRGDPHAS